MASRYRCTACGMVREHASDQKAADAGWILVQARTGEKVRYFVYCSAKCRPKWARELLGEAEAHG